MSIGDIATAAATSATSGTSAKVKKNGFSDMTSEEFMKIMFTELSNQDPMKPNDSNAMLQQLNSIRSIESDSEMITQLKAVTSQNQFASAGTLMGKTVQGLTVDSNRVAGKVVSVSKQGDEVALLLDSGWVLPMSSLEAVLDPSMLRTP